MRANRGWEGDYKKQNKQIYKTILSRGSRGSRFKDFKIA